MRGIVRDVLERLYIGCFSGGRGYFIRRASEGVRVANALGNAYGGFQPPAHLCLWHTVRVLAMLRIRRASRDVPGNIFTLTERLYITGRHRFYRSAGVQRRQPDESL